jgi:Ca2+-transporting ATPase
MSINQFTIQGLDNQQVHRSREKFGQNKLNYKKENSFIDVLVRIVKEPMTILLLVASTIYFISGETGNGIFMMVAILFIASISLYQDSRSKNALEKLKALSQYRN